MPPLNLVVLGPPASGKGTQAERLARARGIPKISTGDILREAASAGTPLGLQAKALIDRGELVSDDIMVEIVRERLGRPDTAGGFILDGFPRTAAQARALDRMLEDRDPLVVVEMFVPREELTRRMKERRVCAQCRTNADPNAAPGDFCTRCGGRMETRQDDSDAMVRLHRLEVYSTESTPLLEFYRKRPTFRSIDGAQSADQVQADMAAAIESAQDLPARTRVVARPSARRGQRP